MALQTKKFPSPADIEKLMCKVVTQKMIEDRATDEVCSVISSKFPAIHFQPDCHTVVEGLWDAVTTKCPKVMALQTKKFPSPADIEKLMCKVVTQKMIEDRATDEVCSVISSKFPAIHFQPDCHTVVEG